MDAKHQTVYLLRLRLYQDVKIMRAMILALVSDGQKAFRRTRQARFNDFAFSTGAKGKVSR